jgi:TRAP-type C4-dicarboxylate transport system permease small subunit
MSLEDIGAALNRGLRWLLGTVLIAAVLINLANVVGRYVFSRPIQATDEILVYLFVCCVFLGAVLVSWEGRHLRMNAVSTVLRAPVKAVLNGLALALFVAMALFVIAQSMSFLARINQVGLKSVATGIPMVVPHAAIPLGFGLMLLAVALGWRRHILGREKGKDAPPNRHQPRPKGRP